MSSNFPLQCQGLSKSFGERCLFRDIHLEISPKDRVALLGASGSGKSTLLHCLSGVTPFDSGDVRLAGQSIATLSAEALASCRRQTIGTVFQFFHLLPTLTAYENVELPLQLLRHDAHQRRNRVESLLERMGISHRADAFPSQLSGGEMQRVAIARAIAHRPAILFADEPTGNLDRESGYGVLELLKQITLEENAALLMVTHSEEAAAICPKRLQLIERTLQLA